MAAARPLLCIHRDPARLMVLREKGFSLITATHGSQGLRLLMSKAVDAVILEYHLGLMDGAVVADEIKRVRPRLPIVMLAETLELPEGALKSVDALVTKSDGPRFLLEALHTVLQANDRLHFGTASLKQAESPGEGAMPSPAKCQILVVDDDQSVRECIAMSLMAAGYDVVAAEDGFRALSQLRKKLPDVVLSDLDMPGMTGFELLSVVRRRFPQISTVAMSGAYVGNELPFRGRLLRERWPVQESALDHSTVASYGSSPKQCPLPRVRPRLDSAQWQRLQGNALRRADVCGVPACFFDEPNGKNHCGGP